MLSSLTRMNSCHSCRVEMRNVTTGLQKTHKDYWERQYMRMRKLSFVENENISVRKGET